MCMCVRGLNLPFLRNFLSHRENIYFFQLPLLLLRNLLIIITN